MQGSGERPKPGKVAVVIFWDLRDSPAHEAEGSVPVKKAARTFALSGEPISHAAQEITMFAGG